VIRDNGDLNTMFFIQEWPEIFKKVRHFPENGYFSKKSIHFLRGALDGAFS